MKRMWIGFASVALMPPIASRRRRQSTPLGGRCHRDRSKWVAQQTGPSGHSLGGDCWVDDPDNIEASGGTLKLISRQEYAPFSATSTPLPLTTEVDWVRVWK
jgi:hypothetical protein